MSFVLVGVSATSGSPAAIQAAAEQAVLRQAPLHVVQAWTSPLTPSALGGRPSVVSVDAGAAAKDAEKKLRAQVHDTLTQVERQPPGDVEIRLLQGTAASVLLNESQGALMLVVDAPQSRVSSTSPLLAYRLVYQASCPVLIMPPAVR